MWLAKTSASINRIVGVASRWLHNIGSWILFAMMMLTLVDVTLRYIFNRPIPGGIEVSEYMMVILVAFTLAYTAFEKGHITVDLIVSKLPPKAQAITNSITTMASLCFFSVVTWQAGLYVKSTVDSGWRSEMLGIPIFPFVGVIAIGCGVLCLVFLADFLRLLSEATKK